MAAVTRPARPTRRLARRLAPGAGATGLTLIELVVAFSLMLILSVMALPVAQVKVQREKERRLREALREIRQAIDRHKDMADEGKLGGLDPDDYGYPKSLDLLVDGVEVGQLGTGLSTGMPGSSGLQSQSPLGSRNPLGGMGANVGTRNSFGTGQRSMDDAFPERGDPLRQSDPLAREDKPDAIRFLRAIPVDPMTGRRDWGLLSVSDDPRSRSWSGRNVFDVYSLSSAIALDGTSYSDW